MIAKTKRDWPLKAIVLFIIILVLIVVSPLFVMMYHSYRYHSYVRDLTSSFVYGESSNTISVSSGDERKPVKKANAHRLFTVITKTGMGKPAKAAPEEEGMKLSFGDDTALEIRPAVITDKGRTNDTGVYFCYTDIKGKTYAYDTDKLQYQDVLDILK